MLYLVRHAHALDAANDAIRKLSPRGHQELAALARLLKQTRAFAPAEIWHSPLVRAKETADVLLRELGMPAPRYVEKPELEPEADPGLIARVAMQQTRSVALVGHEPHLGCLASLLVAGHTSPVVFAVQKSSIIALEPIGLQRCAVRWMLSPEVAE